MSQNQQEQSEAKLLAFIEGELDAVGRAEIEKHLETHPQHRNLLEEMRGMRDWVRWLPKETAPEELAEDFELRLERTMLLGSARQAPGIAPPRINRWPQVRAAAAVAALAVGLGTVVYFALPARHNPFAAAPPSTRPSNTAIALNTPRFDGDSRAGEPTESEKRAQTRESGAVDKLADAPSRNLTPPMPMAMPATSPAGADTYLARGKSTEDLKLAPSGIAIPGTGIPQTAPVIATQPTLAGAGSAIAEPSDQLAEIARGTYSLVGADPMPVGTQRAVNPSGAIIAAPSTAPGSLGLAAGAAGTRDADGPSTAYSNRPPVVMVVLAADADRAHKQIGDYLADKGIVTRSIDNAIDNGNARQAVDGSVAAKPESAVPAAPAVSLPRAAAAPPDPRLRATTVPIVAPPPQAPVAAPTLAPAAARPLVVQPPQSPPAAAFAATPAGRAQRGANGVAAADAPVPTAASVSDQKSSAVKVPSVGPPGAPAVNGRILIACRMTTRQARELQANLRQPAASQWAAVYSESSDGVSGIKQLDDLPAATASHGSGLADKAAAPGTPAVVVSTPPVAAVSSVAAASPLAAGVPPPINSPISGQPPTAQALRQADALPQVGQAAVKDRLATGEASARKSIGETVDKTNRNLAARLPGPEQPGTAHSAATAQPAERAVDAGASPVVAPAPVATAATPTGSGGVRGGAAGGRGGGGFGGGGGSGSGGAVGGMPNQFDRPMFRARRDLPMTGPLTRPATRPIESQHLEKAAGASLDDQPVDVLIVLQQAPETQPAAK